MTSHFSILPSDIIQLLSSSLDNTHDPLQTGNRPLQILRLPHPRTGLPSLFLPLEWLPSTSEDVTNTGMLEIQAVCPADERSWILGEEIIADGTMLTMTPIDSAFLLLPVLQTTEPIDGSANQFRTADDLFEEARIRFEALIQESEKTPAAQRHDILQFCSLECTLKALTRLCDVKEISSEIVVYRYSQTKFIKYLRAKVAHIETSAAFDGSRTLIRSLAKDGLMDDGHEELLRLGRINACCDLIAQYLPSEIRVALLNSYDFAPLLKHLQANKEEAIAAAVSAPAPKGKAKTENKGTAAADKKRKSVKASHGVEKLKKANTNGMAKLSSFFNKS